MGELFDEGASAEEFALPGDEARLQVIRPPEPGPAAPAAPAEPVEPPAATEPVEPAAPAAPTEAATEPPTPAEPAAPAELDTSDPQIAALLEKYGGDPNKALAALAGAQELIGRQGNELGELRRLVEERVGSLEETVRAAAQPQYDADELTEWFAENPTRIPDVARDAFYRGNEQLMDAAIEAWEEVDRSGARKFERDVAVARARQQLAADSEQTNERVAEWNSVSQQFAAAHPDLEQLAPTMRELAPQYPNMLQILQSGTPEARLEVLDFLYEKARGHNGDTLATRSREIAREQAEEGHRAIEQAAVASAAATRTAPAASVAERIASEWDTADAPFKAGESGWNI